MFLSKDTILKLMVTKMIQGCLISILVRVDIPCMVRSLFTFRKCWSVQIISVPCVSKSNTKRFCIWIYNHPAKPQPHRRPSKDLSKRPAWTGWSIPYFSLPVLEEWRRHVGKNDKNQCFGLKYRVDQYREEEKNQRKAIPVCLNKN